MAKSQNIVELFEENVRQADSPDRIKGFLASTPHAPNFVQFRQFIVYGAENLFEKIKSKLTEVDAKVDVINEAAGVLRLERQYGKLHKNISSGYLAVLPGINPRFYRLTSVSFSDYWENVVQYFVRKSFPTFTPIVYKQDELRNALENFEKVLGKEFRVRISDLILKEGQEKKQPKRVTERWWTYLPIQEVFEEAEQSGQWFKVLKFNIEKSQKQNPAKYKEVATGRLTKSGEIKFNWFYNEVNSGIADALEESASKRMNLLARRGVIERNYDPAKPIVVSYKKDIFSETAQVRRFGKTIARYPNSTKAVLHPNPYYHASVADFLDGSSFEIWIVSPDEILIIPQAKSSEEGFERLLGHIFTDFREGEVKEYAK